MVVWLALTYHSNMGFVISSPTDLQLDPVCPCRPVVAMPKLELPMAPCNPWPQELTHGTQQEPPENTEFQQGKNTTFAENKGRKNRRIQSRFYSPYAQPWDKPCLSRILDPARSRPSPEPSTQPSPICPSRHIWSPARELLGTPLVRHRGPSHHKVLPCLSEILGPHRPLALPRCLALPCAAAGASVHLAIAATPPTRVTTTTSYQR